MNIPAASCTDSRQSRGRLPQTRSLPLTAAAASQRHRPLAPLAATLLLVVCLNLASAGAEDLQIAGGGVPARRSVLVDVQEQANQPENAGRVFNATVLTPETLDRWVFNVPAEVARKNYQAMIKLEIAQIDAACGLTAEQQRMLELAGAGELQQIREQLAVLHSQYAGRTYEQNKIGEVFQLIQPLQSQFRRHPLEPNSLLYKLLQTTLDASQKQRLAEWQAERRMAHLNGQIHSAVALIEQQVPLRDSQRQQLIQLLQDEARPLLTETSGRGIAQRGSAIRPTSIIARLNRVPSAELRAFLDDAQWETLKAAFLPQYDRYMPDAARTYLNRRPAKQTLGAPRMQANEPIVPRGLLDELQQQRKRLLENSDRAAAGDAAAAKDEEASP